MRSRAPRSLFSCGFFGTRWSRAIAALCCGALLAACGGGGGSAAPDDASSTDGSAADGSDVDGGGVDGGGVDGGGVDGGPSSCESDDACDDGNPCTAGRCDGGDCVFTPANEGGDCEDGDACTADDHCQEGVCTGASFDGDGDGAISMECGGLDCDDEEPDVYGGRDESLFGDEACADGMDNNCNGRLDLADPSCHPEWCTEDGQCFVSPRHVGVNLRESHAVSANDIWFVGDRGVVLHWTGASLEPHDPSTRKDLKAVWASTDGDVWAIGADVFVHFDGVSWTVTETSETLHAVAGGGGEVYAAGTELFRWNGATFEAVDTGLESEWRALVVNYDGNPWLFASRRAVLWNGATTTGYDVPGPALASITTAHRITDDDTWVAGTEGLAARWDGVEWNDEGASLHDDFVDLGAAGADEPWAIMDGEAGTERWLVQFDGSDWTEAATVTLPDDPTEALTTLDSYPETLVVPPGEPLWLAGRNGFIGRYAAGTLDTWSDLGIAGDFGPVHVPRDDLRASAAGRFGYLFWRNRWEPIELTTSSVDGTAAFAVSEREAWFGASIRVSGLGLQGRLFRYEDGVVTDMRSYDDPVNGIFTTTDQTWIIADRAWEHYGDGGITAGSFDNAILAVDGNEAGEVYASGRSSTLLQWNGSGWTEVETPYDATFEDVWAGDDELWLAACVGATGDGFVAVRREGSWSEPATGSCFRAIAGDEGSDVVAAATTTAFHIWQGEELDVRESLTDTRELSVTGSGAIYATGGDGDGSSLIRVTP